MRWTRTAGLPALLLLTSAGLAGSAHGGGARGEVILLPSGATLTRLTPPSQDAVRPRLSPDGRRVAYVSRGDPSGRAAPVPLESIGAAAESLPTPRGDEIWVVPLSGGEPRRRVAAPPDSGLDPGLDGYSLHDLSWSPDGDRLGFSWYDGRGWAQVLISDPGHPLLRLPVPVVTDPWEEGASFSLSATQMTWSPHGEGLWAYFVAWDDECGSIHRVHIPGPGGDASVASERVPVPNGCLPLLLETPGYWLFRTRESDMSQRVGILNVRGSVVESRGLGVDAPIMARWGASAETGRPPAVLWWREIGQDHVVMSIWWRSRLEEWGHFPCRGECSEPLLVTDRGLWFLERPGDRGRLLLLKRPGGAPVEIVTSRVTALRSSADGSILVAVLREEQRGSSLWRLDLPD